LLQIVASYAASWEFSRISGRSRNHQFRARSTFPIPEGETRMERGACAQAAVAAVRDGSSVDDSKQSKDRWTDVTKVPGYSPPAPVRKRFEPVGRGTCSVLRCVCASARTVRSAWKRPRRKNDASRQIKGHRSVPKNICRSYESLCARDTTGARSCDGLRDLHRAGIERAHAPLRIPVCDGLQPQPTRWSACRFLRKPRPRPRGRRALPPARRRRLRGGAQKTAAGNQHGRHL
jgi:hypothetical protein